MERFIEIAGKKLPVKFTLRSLKIYEEITGRNLLNEECMSIVSLSMGVDALVAFVYCSLYSKEITREELELQMGIDHAAFAVVIDAYVDFIPGFRAIKKKIMEDPALAEKLKTVGTDPTKFRELFYDSLPNQ